MTAINADVGVEAQAGVESVAAGDGGAGQPSIRELVGDGVLDELLARSVDEAGQLWLTGECVYLLLLALGRR